MKEKARGIVEKVGTYTEAEQNTSLQAIRTFETLVDSSEDTGVIQIPYLKALSAQFMASIRVGTSATHDLSKDFVNILMPHIRFIDAALEQKVKESDSYKADNFDPDATLLSILSFKPPPSGSNPDDAESNRNDTPNSSNEKYYDDISKAAMDLLGIDSKRVAFEMHLGAAHNVLKNMAAVLALTSAMAVTRAADVIPARDKGRLVGPSRGAIVAFVQSINEESREGEEGFDLSSPGCTSTLANLWDKCVGVLNSSKSSKESKQLAICCAKGMFRLMSYEKTNRVLREAVSAVVKKKAGEEPDEDGLADVYATNTNDFTKLVKGVSTLFLAQFLPDSLREACGDEIADLGSGIFLSAMRARPSTVREAAAIFWENKPFRESFQSKVGSNSEALVEYF